MAKKIELLHTTYDESGNIESQEVVHPLTSPDCIIMENGKTLDEVMGDGIATPTLTHEGTSFKVGVGDSNIEVVDGDVAGMTLKGQSYQNILPKPTTLIMETDEKEFKINDKIDSNIIIDDNIAEIATVKGKTIVNAVQEESGSEYTVLGEDLSGQSIVHMPEFINIVDYTDITMKEATEEIIGGRHYYTIKEGTDVNHTFVTPQFNNQFLYKPDTDYTIIVDIVENTTGKKLGISNFKAPIDYAINTNSGRDFANLTGISKLVVHTKSDLTQPGQGSEVIQLVYFGIWTASGDLSKHIKFNFMIIEGNHLNTDIPYFEPNGNIKGVTLQGQTLVNTIQEPCKDDYVVLGAEDGIEISAETDGRGTIEDTVQGGINGAVLEGMTLVDLMIPGGTPIIQMSGEYTYTTISRTREYVALEVNTASSNSWGYFHMPINLAMLKPMTKYLVKGDLHNVRSFKIASGDSSIQISNIAYINETNYVILQTSETLSTNSDVKLFIDIIRDAGNVCSVKNLIMVEYQEGMENWDIPYFEGMQSVQMPVLTTTGKNLFDVETSKKGFYWSASETQYTDSEEDSYLSEKYIPVMEGDILIANNLAGSIQYMEYDSNKNFIQRSLGIYYTPYTVPKGVSFLRVSFYRAGVGSNCQIERGTKSTPFEPYKSNILTVNEEVTLRAIGDVKDELDLTTGKLTQRIEEVSLANMNVGVTNEYHIDSCTTFIFGDWSKKINVASSVHSNRLPFPLTDEGVFFDGWGLYLRISNSRLTTTDSTGLNEWMIREDFRIIYPMKTESVKTIDLTVTDQDGNTIPHIQTQPTVTHITASSDYLIPTVTIDNNLAYDTIIKPSTLYTVRFKHDTVNTDNPLTVDLGGATQTVTSTEFTITTPSTLTHNQLVFSGKNNVVSEVQVIEGDVVGTQYPFFEGMNDVKFSDSKFIGRGKNLYNIEAIATSKTNSKVQFIRNNNTFTLTSMSSNGACYIDCLDFPIYFKGGETYVLTSNFTTNNSDAYIRLFKVLDNGATKTFFQSEESITSDKIVKTFNPIEDIVVYPSFYVAQSTDGKLGGITTYTNFQIEESSTATSYEPYKGVEVQQDVDSIPLTSDMFEQGTRERGMGMSLQQCPLTSNTARISSKTLIPVKPNSKYTVLGIDTSVNHIWGDMYDKDGLVCYDGVLDLTGGISSGAGVSVPHDVHYLCIKIKNVDESAITPSDLDSLNLILQEVPQEIVLRGIGDVKDELDLTRGEYIQRIGEVVLDGSEIWRDDSVNLYVKEGDFTSAIPTHLLNGRHIKDSGLNVLMGHNYVFLIHKQDLPEGIEKTNVAWKTYLQANPITVQYQFATPIIHKVNLTNTKVIQSYSTETHYETITPSNSLIPNITIPSTLNYDVAIKPSTEYTIRANTSDNLTVDLGGATGTLSNGKVTLTTPVTLTHNEVKFSGAGKVKELMVVEGNEIKDNVPFFNGMKNVEMGGIKLVNIARGARIDDSGRITINTNKTQFTYKNSSSTDTGTITFTKELVKPNTLYTIYCEIPTNTIDREIKIQIGDGEIEYLNIPKNYTGVYKVLLTSPQEIKHIVAIYFRSSSTLGQVVIENPMIIEGDWTHLDKIPFIESEMIIEQPIIRSQGKNLFDISRGINYTWHAEYTINGDGSVSIMPTLVDGVAYVQSEFFFLEVGKTYTVSWNASGNVHASFVWLAGTTNSPYGTSNTFTVVEGKNKLTLAMYVDTSSLENVATFKPQIEEGSTATSYEPYKHQTLYSNRVIGYEEGCYYQHENGSKIINTSYNSIIADVEGLSIAYITHGHSNFSFWDKDGVYISGKAFMDTNRYGDSNNNGFITVPSNAKYIKFPSGNSSNVSCRYSKATVTGELPLRSLPNGVCDTLNLVTGEYVQRVAEIIIDSNSELGESSDKSYVFTYTDNLKTYGSVTSNLYSTKGGTDDTQYIFEGIVGIGFFYNKLNNIHNLDDFKQYLSQNPITVQYELATPIVRKLGFTTKGNYAGITLNGGEDLYVDGNINNADTARFEVKVLRTGNTVYYDPSLATVWFDNFDSGMANTLLRGQVSAWSGDSVMFALSKYNTNVTNLQEFTQWLGLNSSTLGFLTRDQSSESYSNIHKPIFFNNVNVQFLPHNLDIQPQLTLQARTRNSYVMDMMKGNTKYTIKLLNFSGNMKIDGVSYTLSKNRTFVSPSTLTNKELIVSGWYEPMIIEGDVTAKNLPYFKGILSSYHDVDEIEIHSVNKNLFDMSRVKPYDKLGTYWWNTIVKENEVVSVRIGDINNGQFGAYVTLDVRPNSVYTLYMEMEKDGEPYNGQIYGYENDDLWGNGTFTGYANTPYHISTSHNAKYITIGFNYGKDFPIGTKLVAKNMRLYLGEESPVYIPHSHNTTLIEMPTRLETVKVVRPIMENGAINTGTGASYDDGDALVRNVRTKDYLPVQPGEIIKFYNNGQGRAVNIHYYDINKQFIKYEFYDGTSTRPTVPKDCYFVRMYCGKSACSDITLTRQAYKPIQLNSLPNGVYDEIIMKPNSNKARLVQRVGKVVLDGVYLPLSASAGEVKGDDISCTYSVLNNVAGGICQSDKLLNVSYSQDYKNIECIMLGTNTIIASILKTRAYNAGEYAKENPITVYYELTTPIIHEIQLKGYPHVYENGTVTLNTDTPHQTLVSYNVNQEQLINTQNETIIRHDQQIDDLYYYIEMYLEEIYQMELFRMKLELSL